MSSDAVVKTVAKKLKYYFEVKRLEDGFDLSGSSSPQLDHPPLKSRPTLQYDGLHDRALKHYFSLPEVRVQLTQMGPKNPRGAPREKEIDRLMKRYMARHRFMHPTLPEYSYVHSPYGAQRKLRPEMTGFGVPLKSNKKKSLKGGWPQLRSVPGQKAPKGETNRLINMATKLLVATETVDMMNPRPPSPKRSQSAPKPFEGSRSKRRPATATATSTAKYSYDVQGRRHDSRKSYDDSYYYTDSAYATRSGTGSPQPERQEDLEPETPEKPKKRERPRSAKRRPRNTVINMPETRVEDEVTVHSETQTGDSVGIQTEKRLLEKYDHMEDEVTEGPWAEYQIYVRTGNRIGASTKADVKITLYGDKGRTKEMLLTDSKRHIVKFQKGKEDLFIVAVHHIGKMRKVKIGHDRPELNYAWYLEGVTVYDMHDKRIYDFSCERWLSGQDGDRRTYREIPVEMDRAFLEEFSSKYSSSEDVKVGADRYQPSSTTDSESHGRKDKTSVKVQGSQINEESESESESGSESVSESESGSSSSSYSETKTESSDRDHRQKQRQTSARETRQLSPPRQAKKDEFFDQKTSGPTFTFRTPEGEKVPDSSDVSTKRTESVDSQSQRGRQVPTEKDYLAGYKAGLEAAEAESRKKHRDEDAERKKVLRGKTIHEAAKNGDYARVKELLEHFPEMNEMKDETGWTALHLATKEGHIDIVRWLANTDMNLNMETPTGYTPIHVAAMFGHVSCLMVLAALGAAVTCRSTDKQTPLHLAAMGGHMECVKWLVANRATLDARDIMGQTPHDLAAEYHHREVADFLKSCEEELADPKSSFALLRTSDKKHANLATIEEDARSSRSGQSQDEGGVWKDDKGESRRRSTSSDQPEGSENAQSAPSQTSQKDLEEKRKLYDQQHHKMEDTGTSFLDSIRQDVEDDG